MKENEKRQKTKPVAAWGRDPALLLLHPIGTQPWKGFWKISSWVGADWQPLVLKRVAAPLAGTSSYESMLHVSPSYPAPYKKMYSSSEWDFSFISLWEFSQGKKKDFIRLCIFSAQCGHCHASSWDLCLRMEVLGGWSLKPKCLTRWGYHKYLPHWIRCQQESFSFVLMLLLNFHIT